MRCLKNALAFVLLGLPIFILAQDKSKNEIKSIEIFSYKEGEKKCSTCMEEGAARVDFNHQSIVIVTIEPKDFYNKSKSLKLSTMVGGKAILQQTLNSECLRNNLTGKFCFIISGTDGYDMFTLKIELMQGRSVESTLYKTINHGCFQ